MIQRDFEVSFIADLALREKQIQQNYRPIIAVHKGFARPPGTLFRGLLLAEFAEAPVKESFYRAHHLQGLRIADPFMGGGTPLLEASRVGCDVVGHDINPMSYWIVKQEIEHLDLDAHGAASENLVRTLEEEIRGLYRTRCKPDHKGRFFKTPDSSDLVRLDQAESAWNALRPLFVPDDPIPGGEETDRLHRSGYRHYREMFNSCFRPGVQSHRD
jgi:adenine-specific DNA methylase